MFSVPSRRIRVACLIVFMLVAGSAMHTRARAQASEASALSLLPVAMISAAPAALFASGVTLTVVGVEASAQGSVWLLERASDGARATLKLASASTVAVGTAVVVTAMSAGWVLSAAGQAIACIPNDSSASLLYNERVTQ